MFNNFLYALYFCKLESKPRLSIVLVFTSLVFFNLETVIAFHDVSVFDATHLFFCRLEFCGVYSWLYSGYAFLVGVWQERCYILRVWYQEAHHISFLNTGGINFPIVKLASAKFLNHKVTFYNLQYLREWLSKYFVLHQIFTLDF